MATIAEMRRRVDSVKLRDKVPEIIVSNGNEIIDYNEKQLLSGKKSDGSQIGKYRSQEYSDMKNALNPKPGHGNADLRLTGRFQDSMYLDVNAKGFELDSSDSKSSNLKAKYGDTIFGLSDENKAKFSRGSLFDGVKKHIRNVTGMR